MKSGVHLSVHVLETGEKRNRGSLPWKSSQRVYVCLCGLLRTRRAVALGPYAGILRWDLQTDRTEDIRVPAKTLELLDSEMSA